MAACSTCARGRPGWCIARLPDERHAGDGSHDVDSGADAIGHLSFGAVSDDKIRSKRRPLFRNRMARRSLFLQPAQWWEAMEMIMNSYRSLASAVLALLAAPLVSAPASAAL